MPQTSEARGELLDAVREAIPGVTHKYDRAYFLAKSKAGEDPVEMWQAMAEQGLLAAGVPESLGGMGGGVTANVAIMEGMSQVGVPPLMFSLTSFCREALIRHGTQEQIEDHVLPTLTGERRFSFAITEPDAGTNSFALRTKATRRPDGGYTISGQKIFISGADESDHILLVARTDTPEPGRPRSDGISLFVIPTKSPGITMQPLNVQWYAPENQFIVYFDDVEVPAGALVGEEGRGANCLFDCLNAERLIVSAWALGLGDYALSKAVAYANERKVWRNVPIGTYQGVQHPLARAKTGLDAARTMIYDAAAKYDEGLPVAHAGNEAKLLATEAACEAVDVALQVHGGYGFVEEYDIVTLWPMVRILRVAPINNEMVLNYIGERVLGLPRSY